jgi:hypothetical protein
LFADLYQIAAQLLVVAELPGFLLGLAHGAEVGKASVQVLPRHL